MKKFSLSCLIACSFLSSFVNANAQSNPNTQAIIDTPTPPSAQPYQTNALLSNSSQVVVIENKAPAAIRSKNAAIYFKMLNQSNNQITLTSISSDVADITELHKTITDAKGVSSMQKVDKVVIPANSSFEFKPGADHIMLIGLKKDFVTGDKLTINLHFDDNKTQSVELVVDSKKL